MDKNIGKETAKKRGRPKKNPEGKTVQAKPGKQKATGKNG
ncbi:hypothetical protein SCALIN_C17_0020 [Candidatus Scalindua japonica]|uniref:Uncharacterized protein n=1 Tax=Candidatus Scalindua japonica TaxID=1284222 RepID=A0A286TYM5_9BACT|nr:hypothetical protein SCALIN_C17_0020 [Candidatus Scalindua japonica]